MEGEPPGSKGSVYMMMVAPLGPIQSAYNYWRTLANFRTKPKNDSLRSDRSLWPHNSAASTPLPSSPPVAIVAN